MFKIWTIYGGSGFIGSHIIEKLRKKQDNIIYIVTRNKNRYKDTKNIHYINLDDHEQQKNIFKETDVIINLAGEGIVRKAWTIKRKKKILHSRTNTTKNIVKFLKEINNRPFFIQASAIGYYGKDSNIKGEDYPHGEDFLSWVSRDWEKEANHYKEIGGKILILRLGYVLGHKGGIIKEIWPYFSKFLGGHLGDGQNWMSWIHIQDVVYFIYQMAMENNEGVFNLVAPEPILSQEFCQLFGKAIRRPSWLHAPKSVLTFLYGKDLAEYLLSSQKVFSKNIKKINYTFKHPHIEGALEEIARSLK